MEQNKKMPERIIIKSSKSSISSERGTAIIYLFFIILMVVLIGRVIWGGTMVEILYGMLLCVAMILVWMVYVLTRVVPVFRKIIMSAEGCTISLLWFQKTYKWDEFAFIKECSWRIFSTTRGVKDHGIIFSVDPVEIIRPNRLVRSWKYLSSFYITYYVPFESSYYFRVDKEKILGCLETWGVSVQKSDI